MKKIMLMAFAIGTLGFAACSDENDEDNLSCTELEQIIVEARADYEREPENNEYCQALRAALDDYLDEGCNTNFDPDDIRAEMDALDCESGI